MKIVLSKEERKLLADFRKLHAARLSAALSLDALAKRANEAMEDLRKAVGDCNLHLVLPELYGKPNV